MNQSILHSSFPLDYPVSSDPDYSAHRPYSGSSGFSMDDDDDDHTRRVNNPLGQHPLAQPVSIPASSALRYNSHDVNFATSPSMLMSPGDSCSAEPFSPTSTPLYSHSPSLPYDRMSDYRSRVASSLQSSLPQSTTVGSSGILGRADNYPSSGSYALHRGPFPLPDRMSSYTSTPRAFDSTIDRSSSYMLSQGHMYMDPMHRFSQSILEAPPFQKTDVLQPEIIAGINGSPVKPEIQAKIHGSKKFLHVDDKWTCYRRNYLSVSCSFSLHPYNSGPCHLRFPDQTTERVRNFAMAISAIINAQSGETRELVQHSPKRDKESERTPGKVVLQPCQPSHLGIGPGSASNGSQHGLFALASQQPTGMFDYSSSYGSTSASPAQPPNQHTFERIQFQKATANNGKRRATQQFYNLVVNLYAEIASPSGTQWVKIAQRLSDPMVVRGRSPGHYRDRRNSSTSMPPDGSTGGSGDSTSGAMLPPGVGKAPPSSLTLMSPYSRGDYPHHHHHIKTEQSPLDSPHISSSSSSTAFDIPVFHDSMDPMDTIKTSSSSMGSYDGTFASSAGYEPIYSVRPGEDSSYGRFDSVHSAQGLCT